MIPFQAPLDDILFTLTEVAGAGRLPGWDDDLAQEILGQFARLAETAIAPADAAADAIGCRLEAGRVKMPPPLVAAYAAYAAQGWPGLTLPEAAGGQEMPGPLAGAVTEIFAGASHALQMVAGLVPGAARTIARFGSPAQQALWLPRLASGDWLATMALTEPGAGSDLSALRTRAEPGPGGGWRISGEKTFISGGDQDLSPHVLHLVLARSGAAESGTRGLSLFLVPSQAEDGGRAPVQVSRIEEKMGLHGSPTCQMLFEAAPGEMIGAEGEGLRAMFTLMNHARLDVALQGVAHAGRAARIARHHAEARVQGQARRPLTAHADVRRMLDAAEALTLGNRALVQIALVEMEAGARPALVDWLTPLCKFSGTEAGVEAASLAMQVMGGYGYLREYAVEQALRDARITPIYEGANGIQAATLAGRLLRGPAAEAFAAFLAEVPEARAAWQPAREAMAAAPDNAAAADAFMRLSVAAALALAWARIAAAAPRAREPARIAALAAQARARLPLQMQHQAAMVALALAEAAAADPACAA